MSHKIIKKKYKLLSFTVSTVFILIFVLFFTITPFGSQSFIAKQFDRLGMHETAMKLDMSIGRNQEGLLSKLAKLQKDGKDCSSL